MAIFETGTSNEERRYRGLPEIPNRASTAMTRLFSVRRPPETEIGGVDEVGGFGSGFGTGAGIALGFSVVGLALFLLTGKRRR